VAARTPCPNVEPPLGIPPNNLLCGWGTRYVGFNRASFLIRANERPRLNAATKIRTHSVFCLRGILMFTSLSRCSSSAEAGCVLVNNARKCQGCYVDTDLYSNQNNNTVTRQHLPKAPANAANHDVSRAADYIIMMRLTIRFLTTSLSVRRDAV